jgi:hypothetical protein
MVSAITPGLRTARALAEANAALFTSFARLSSGSSPHPVSEIATASELQADAVLFNILDANRANQAAARTAHLVASDPDLAIRAQARSVSRHLSVF